MEMNMCEGCDQCDDCIGESSYLTTGKLNAPKKEKQIVREIHELNGAINYLEKAVAELKKVLLNSVCRDWSVPTTNTDNKKVEQHLVPVAEDINAAAKRIRNINNTISNLIDGSEL